MPNVTSGRIETVNQYNCDTLQVYYVNDKEVTTVSIEEYEKLLRISEIVERLPREAWHALQDWHEPEQLIIMTQ